MTKSTIENEIATAFEDSSLSSDALRDLQMRVTEAADTRRSEAVSARMRALEPALGQSEAAVAYQEAERLQFEADRFRVAAERLEDLVDERTDEEEQATKWSAYNRAQAQTERVADLIKAEYPNLERKLSQLILEIIRANIAVSDANADLPDEAPILLTPEAMARSFPDSTSGAFRGGGPVTIAEMVVPKFQDCLTASWPPKFNPYPGAPRVSLQQLESMVRHGEL
ncbi:hypothetical protein [Pseudoruegeria sp. HB172150]|uniref:hypothetical protein n=1 Tax=Pseudoruegeria sp. HB172150 TaxID=2721164 RepID=UPI001554791E|nr:hypothetical protein [Pseudoruegeria sp. HB172150]